MLDVSGHKFIGILREMHLATETSLRQVASVQYAELSQHWCDGTQQAHLVYILADFDGLRDEA